MLAATDLVYFILVFLKQIFTSFSDFSCHCEASFSLLFQRSASNLMAFTNTEKSAMQNYSEGTWM
ncbi:MAG TPA: hypothetical protein DHV12_06455 [Thermotogae bacterium]|nr:hypothetical protein [Thermotogota bacterium]